MDMRKQCAKWLNTMKMVQEFPKILERRLSGI